MAMFVRAAKQFSPLLKEITNCLCRKIDGSKYNQQKHMHVLFELE